MKHHVVVLSVCASLCLFGTNTLLAADNATATSAKPVVKVIKKEDSSGIKDMLARLWGKLRAASPKVATQDDKAATQVAGVRGAEATDSALQPYWQDDKESDPAFVQQVNSFKSAQQLADAGDYGKAATAFESFLKAYPDSSLKANAEFGCGLSYISAGNAEKGKLWLKTFVGDYPQHPMVADARTLMK